MRLAGFPTEDAFRLPRNNYRFVSIISGRRGVGPYDGRTIDGAA